MTPAPPGSAGTPPTAVEAQPETPLPPAQTPPVPAAAPLPAEPTQQAALPPTPPPKPQPAPPAAPSDGSNALLGFDLGGDSKKPMTIEADQGIEWQHTNHVYIARGHATAKRGNGTVTADTLTAHYRPAAKAPTAV